MNFLMAFAIIERGRIFLVGKLKYSSKKKFEVDMIRVLLFAIILSSVLLQETAFASCSDGEVVIRFSHVVSPDRHPKGISANKLAELVNEEMDGSACMQVFPSAQLFDDRRVLEALLLGDIQIAAPRTARLAEASNQYRIFEFPLVFRSFAAVKAFMATDVADDMSASLAQRGLVPLEVWHGGMVQFFANKPIRVPENASGVKLRGGVSASQDSFLESLGASTFRMRLDEAANALSTGKIDGLQTTYMTFANQQLSAANNSVTETNHALLSYTVVASVEWLDSLDAEVKQQFINILRKVTGEHNVSVVRQNRAAKEDLVSAGVSVHELSNEEHERWIQASDEMLSRFADSDMLRAIEIIRGINETCLDGCCEDCCEDDEDDCNED